jgi:aspartyl-tRNA(Asn)/glutamyl-tRNA(Gln) amidotransferase subunit A
MSNLLGDLPRLFPRPEQTIAGVGRLLRQGEVSCVDILNACLEQVDEWEPKVHAWVVLDRDGAMVQARALDEELRADTDRGPLHGIPIGIKDIIAVRGLPITCGVPRRHDRIVDVDADVVERLRAAGAVIMGKTVTTPYAWIDPPPTRNPWKSDRSPGGSSSGSATAVACGMCYGAIGTQTGGSITRPASFCGVAGMKPTFGRVSTLGILPLAPSLDHVGPIARSVEDLRSMYSAITPHEPDNDDGATTRAPEDGPPRIGRPRGFFDRRAEPAVRSAIEASAKVLTACGAEIVDLDDPLDFEAVLQEHRRVMAAEAASFHAPSLEANPDEYPPLITQLIMEGRSILAWEYIRSRESDLASRIRVFSAMNESGVSCLITPATMSTATDPSTTGDPAFNSPWSHAHLPTVSLPVALANDAMPVAIQLVGDLLSEDDLLSAARWCERAIQTREP